MSLAGHITSDFAALSMQPEAAEKGRLTTNSTDPTTVSANDAGRATTTSTATEVAAVSPTAKTGVDVLNNSATTQRKVIGNLVFMLVS